MGSVQGIVFRLSEQLLPLLFLNFSIALIVESIKVYCFRKLMDMI